MIRHVIFFFFLITLCITPIHSFSQPNPISLEDELDLFIKDVQEQVGIPGIAIAIIKDEKVLFKRNYGFANLEHEVLISEKSKFLLYSLTKSFISVGVFNLIEQNKLSLEDSISSHVADLPESWHSVQVKHLLSHSSGLPDIFVGNPYEQTEYNEEQAKERVFSLPISFEAGKQYEYNQTNFWLLKLIIEKVSEKGLSEFIIDHQFPDASEKDVFFSYDSRDIIKHRVTSYFPWLKGELIIDLPYNDGDYLVASNGLHITLDEFIDWDRRFNSGKIISEESKKTMWEVFPYSDSKESFAYNWNVYKTDNSLAYGFSGSMCTIYRTIPSKNLSIIFLSNGFTNMFNQRAIIDFIEQIVLD